MKNLILLILFVPLSVLATPQEKFNDEFAKAKVDHARAVRECNAMPLATKEQLRIAKDARKIADESTKAAKESSDPKAFTTAGAADIRAKDAESVGRAACLARVNKALQDVQKGLKAQHLEGKK
jgi:hypothetical protein